MYITLGTIMRIIIIVYVVIFMKEREFNDAELKYNDGEAPSLNCDRRMNSTQFVRGFIVMTQ